MKAHSKEFKIGKRAEVLGVSRGGYYEFIERKPSKRALENEALVEEIKKTHKNSRGLYGSARLHTELRKQGQKCSRNRVSKFMKQEKI